MSVLLLVRPDQNVGTYGRYLGEILRSEGLVAHDVVAVPGPAASDLPASLDAYDAVLVARQRTSRAQAGALAEYARGGGRLVVVRPSYALADELGLRLACAMVDPAYVRPLPGHPATDGVPHEPIETHTPADAYTTSALPVGTRVLAQLGADARTPTSFPAMLHLPVGAGEVVVFTYDLAHAVALVRQGDPRRVGGRGAGAGTPYRIQDLLLGFADPASWHLPQADIHAMLLGNAVNTVARAPQPRLWYYPDPETRSVVVLDADDDWSAPEHFEALLGAVEGYGGGITCYLMMGPTMKTVADPGRVAAWRERGHSFGIHHDPYDPELDGEDQEEILGDLVRSDVAEFERSYGGTPLTNRNHCVAWQGYTEVPEVFAELGVVMDLNSVNSGPSWLAYLTGSARPMRFVALDGSLVDCFQQATQVYDDWTVMPRLSTDPAGEAALTRNLMEDKVSRYYSPLSAHSHPVSFATYSREYHIRCWDAARELGMPFWSAVEWAEFTCARDSARILDTHWDGRTFGCRVEGRSPRGALTLALPVASDRVESARVDGEPVGVTGIDLFGWPSTLTRIEVDGHEPSTRDVRLRVGDAPHG